MRIAFIMGALTLIGEVIAAGGPADAASGTKILWDSWGVPHIRATDDRSLFYALGWAEMEAHGDLILRLYGQARGRAAEYWGEHYLSSDRLTATIGFAEQAPMWYTAQTPEFRRNLDAFAAGMNGYATSHPSRISSDLQVVLPISGVDVLAHVRRLLYDFIANGYGSCGGVKEAAGSNAWAIAPSDSVDHHAMLLINPHLSWSGLVTLEEAQLTAPGIDVYGAGFVGVPVLSFAFNQDLGWSHTVNTVSGCDAYELTTVSGGYVLDGRVKQFQRRVAAIKIRHSNGMLSTVRLTIRRSAQGPVVMQNGRTFAMRIVGVDQFPAVGVLQEWWDMARARSLQQFLRAQERLQIPVFTVIYADRVGNIMSFFGGEVPVRTIGNWETWQRFARGDDSANIWTSIHGYSELPTVIDPLNGWVQNSNSPPWFTAMPQVLDRSHYPADLAPNFLDFREQQGIKMLVRDHPMSLSQMIADKLSARSELADRVLDPLIEASKQFGNEESRAAALVLKKWDRKFQRDSRGAVLFFYWADEMHIESAQSNVFAIPWNPNYPLLTPAGLADLQAADHTLRIAAKKVVEQFSSLDIPWGSAFPILRGGMQFSADGGPGDPLGIFRSMYFVPAYRGSGVTGGDCFIAAVEFSTPIRAKVLLTYGSSTQPHSSHNGDQLALYAQNRLRDAWTSTPEIRAHLSWEEDLSTIRSSRDQRSGIPAH